MISLDAASNIWQALHVGGGGAGAGGGGCGGAGGIGAGRSGGGTPRGGAKPDYLGGRAGTYFHTYDGIRYILLS